MCRLVIVMELGLESELELESMALSMAITCEVEGASGCDCLFGEEGAAGASFKVNLR